MDELPIACSLSADDYEQRLSSVRPLGRVALLDARIGPDGALLWFRDSEAVRDQLSSIVEAESLCCPFLGLKFGSDEGRLTLAVFAPPEAMPVVRDLIDSFQGHPVS